MSQVYNKIVLDVKKKNNDIITAVQNDANSRFLDVVLTDGTVPINLTGHEVRIYGRKYDGTEIYNNGVITDATKGRCQFELTSQALAVANDLQVNVVISKNNKQILSTPIFTIHVVKSLLSDSAIESSNEYGALVVLYQNLYEAYDLMMQMVQKIGVPGVKAQAFNLKTMFAVWDYLIDYLEKNSSAGVVATLNEVNAKIGNSSDTADTTVFGTMNKGVIKSVQRGTCRLSSPTAQLAISISKIEPKKSDVTLYGISSSYSEISSNRASIGLPSVIGLSETVLSVKGSNSNTSNMETFSWQVVEYL